MNNNETYTYKQILLGLREEYVKANKILDELSNHIYSTSKLMDYNFILYKTPYTDDNNPELLLGKTIKDDKILFELLYKILFRTKTTYMRTTMMLSDNNGNYYPKSKKFNIVIK